MLNEAKITRPRPRQKTKLWIKSIKWWLTTYRRIYIIMIKTKPHNDYVLPHQHLWTFDVLVCPLSVTERFLLQPLICRTVFHRTSLLSPLSPSSAVVLNHITSHFLIPLSDSSLICTVPMQWLVILNTIIVFTFNIYRVIFCGRQCLPCGH